MAELEVALIGAGGIARAHLPAWAALGARVRVYAPDGRAPALAREFGATSVGSLGEAIAGAHVVDVCTPTDTHREITLTAVAAGAHVLCEKPLALNATEAGDMADAAEAAGVRLYPGHVVRFFPAYARLRDLVAGGGLGRVAVARFTRTGRYPTWSGWFADPARSGGILTDQMIHDMDIARWLFGDVVRVHARQQGHLTAPAPEGAVATGTAVLTHAGGAITQVVGVWGPTATPFRTTFHVSGTGGTVQHDSRAHLDLRITGAASGGPADGIPAGDLGGFGDLGESPYLIQIREFAEAFAGGPEPRVSARDGVAAVRIAEAAAESARTGRTVELTAQATTVPTGGIDQ
ncbi:Gfo/Idh/MocA family protein [Streptomyces sp. NL15-2K]|uniref:Gfo/Idh/MocA family protein n=1 Tax=Streptomyces sp. NL15-2K TaxID=376149 RepID=UPI000F55F6F6|nr:MULTISPECIES: Gfo/Idh/MocA family oxidoreductase [Actinomycetes]WKX10051.1 Gfo/Idh/MocA family oxidoreductase [Kutzneria buriramensis]GCB51663.1 myo-inositol 2-dehydrogenase [Streptomyces sp. NL15-2K]